MSRLFHLFFLLQVLAGATGTLEKGDEGDLDDFVKRCPPQRCSSGGPEIRYPLRLESSPPSCGATGLVLSCSDGHTILPMPSVPPSLPLSIVNVNYPTGHITVKLDEPYWSSCLLQNMSHLNFSSSSFQIYSKTNFILVNCSRRIPLTNDSSISGIAGPISCFSGTAHFAYAVNSFAYMDILPPYCVMISGGGWIPSFYWTLSSPDLTSWIDLFIQKREIAFGWTDAGIADHCVDCEYGGGRCGFSEARNQSFCYKTEHRSKAKLIVGTAVAGAASAIILASILFFYTHKKSAIEEDMRLKIENFLASYQNTKPTRYSYSEIKKITARFKHKLGQGGFGSVYKGQLPNGIPVAVKIIEIEKSGGEEFMNEVATMGRIHHVNIVRLLGFCSQGTVRALIYEFMPNESLEKFIFSEDSSNRFHGKLRMDQLQQIAIGIAQGIEYLHQGCDQRILHFDIKPHNILLDHSFIPKISDFGFAKLCSRDHCMIPMTVARGTMGYIAPEIYSRNFGTVSGKSDVYSFGMLLMEMVSGRKNADPSIEDQSAIYYPEWVYDRLVRGLDLDSFLERRGEEEKIAKKLIVVALWCVQWSPMDRPLMTRVVQMLMGEFTASRVDCDHRSPFHSTVSLRLQEMERVASTSRSSASLMTIFLLGYLFFLIEPSFVSGIPKTNGGLCALIVQPMGYPCTEYTVQTEDGYLLTLQRISNGQSAFRGSNGPPVFLQHGLFQGGDTWFLNSVDESLGFILADHGFDVWVGNVRGTRWSRKHITLSEHERAFWDWSWQDLAQYDLAAMLSYIQTETSSKVLYIGHSQGTIMALAAFTMPDMVKMVEAAALLCPISYLDHISSNFVLRAVSMHLDQMLLSLGIHQLNFRSNIGVEIMDSLCDGHVDCGNLLGAITGDNCCFNASRVEYYLEYEPHSSSTKNLHHLFQMIRKGTFAKYDFGWWGNLKRYHTLHPPAFNLGDIPESLPLWIGYGGSDALADLTDLKRTIQELRSKPQQLYIDSYGHIDFVLSVKARDDVYGHLISFLRSRQRSLSSSF